MSLDPSSIETALGKLRATALDDALLARLEACTAGKWAQLTPDEEELEMQLRAIAPTGIRPALQDSLESIVARVPFPAENKIIPLPTASSRKSWVAAAAVALIGAFSAWMIPAQRSPQTAQDQAARIVSQQPDVLTPASFNRDLSEASDQGVVWQSNHQGHRVLKVVYMERVTLKDANGKTYQVEQPRVEYILTPQTAN